MDVCKLRVKIYLWLFNLKYIFIFIVLVNTLLGDHKNPAVVSYISPGAISQGLGEAMIAYTETADMSYFNPAAMSFSDKNRISVAHNQWKPNLAWELYLEFIAFNYKLNDKYTIGGNYIYFNMGELIGMDAMGNFTSNWHAFESVFSINVSYRLSNYSSIGLAAKTFIVKHFNDDGIINQAFDFSYFIQNNNNLNTGFQIANISSDHSAPTIISWGILKKVYQNGQNTIKALSQIDKHLRFNEEIIYKVGIEYNFSGKYFFRTGYMYGHQPYEEKLNNPTYGFGVHLKKLYFDFGYTFGYKDHLRANTKYFSILYNI